MRTLKLAPLAVLVLLGACSSVPDQGRQISQSGTLRVHPGLLGRNVPDELREPQAVPVAKVEENADAGMKMDPVGLRAQRSVYFDYKSELLKTDYDALLQAHGRFLAEHPNARVRVEGNADERGSAGYNNQLGLKRAENVRQRLLEQGAATAQVRVKSLGEARPKLKGHDEESWAENRRADIVYEREE